MTRQFEQAEATLHRAIDLGPNRLDKASAVNTLMWSYLRQGMLSEAGELGIKWADIIEPTKFSQATVLELSLWGRILLGVTNAAIRNNQPGDAEDALSCAKAAADRIGREIEADAIRMFGPVTVGMIDAESRAIIEQPDRVMEIASTIPKNVLKPTQAGRLRHRLDVANAHVMLKQYPDAMGVLQEINGLAPEWLEQQRYARDILSKVIERRRTLTQEMRDLADSIRLEY